jgi:hypothetical protein
VTASASDAGGVAGVQFTLDGSNLGSEDTTAPYSASWDTRTASNGAHTLAAVAHDLAGNAATASSVSVTVANAGLPPGLVASYGFEEGSGTTTADASGNNNQGTLTNGAGWAAAGKHGKAATFDGVNDFVSVADSSSLDLTTGMTLEAWVNPAALGTAWRTVIFKQQPGDLVYGLYANRNTKVPLGQIFVGGSERDANGTAQLPLNQWSHLAATYDGSTLKVWLNGAQVGTLAIAGAIPASTGPFLIGGDAVFSEWFQGSIDDVLVYNRALSQTEIQADMNRNGAG